jgi:D-aminopeptidase
MVMSRSRARDLGVNLGKGSPGSLNSITDVKGVRVGHTTLIAGEGKLIPGSGPIRTGITAILAHEGNLYQSPVVGTTHVINGYGKAVGIAQLLELGRIDTPLMITSTLNVGIVEDALTQFMIEQNPKAGISQPTPNPIVAECHDGYLNDAQGRHVRKEHVYSAITSASRTVEEGNVGAGTGMMAYGYKSGVGTASRKIPLKQDEFTIGCLVVPNCGRRGTLVMGGLPVGRLLEEKVPTEDTQPAVFLGGSIIVVLATDAPLTSRQLQRLARRAVIGIGRTGSVVSHGSGDFVFAFSTAYRDKRSKNQTIIDRPYFQDQFLTPLFAGVIEATEEAILNALCMATKMVGRDGHVAEALPLSKVSQLFS